MLFFAALLNLALLTSNKFPESDKVDDKILIEALREYNIAAQPVDWRSPDVIWSDFDAVLVYSTWDYYEDYPKFLSTLQKIESMNIKLFNYSSIIQWNACKKYLKDLEKLGLKTIESVYISANELDNLQSILIEKGWDDCVIKPQISTSGYHTFRFNLSNIEHIQDYLKNFDEQFIIQPFAEEIIAEGEWSFVFFDREYIHCMLKKPLEGNFRVQKGIKIPIQPPEWMIKEAQHIIETINRPALQTRVDVIRRGNEIRIMEIEMIEPSLYLRYFPGSEKRIARKISEKLNLSIVKDDSTVLNASSRPQISL